MSRSTGHQIPDTLSRLESALPILQLEALLIQLEARNPVTFIGAAAVLVAAGVLAVWLPARRAARLDPATVLREGWGGSTSDGVCAPERHVDSPRHVIHAAGADRRNDSLAEDRADDQPR